MADYDLAATTLDQNTSTFSDLVSDIYCSICGMIYRQSTNGKILFCDTCNTSKPISKSTIRPMGYSSTFYLKNRPELRIKELLNFNNAELLAHTTMICPSCKTRAIKKYCIPDNDKSSIGHNLIFCTNCLENIMKESQKK